MKAHLFVQLASGPLGAPDGVSSSLLPAQVAAAAEAIEAVLAARDVDTLVFWDPRVGAVPWAHVERFAASLDDAWHPGGTPVDDPAGLLRYPLPLWIYRPAPPPEVAGAINWRLDLRAAIVRADVLRRSGGLDRGFDTLAGAALELGLRLLRRGAVCRQQPALLARPLPVGEAVPRADRYRLLRGQVNAKWTAYSLARSMLDEPRGALAELQAWRATAGFASPERAPIGALQRDLDAVRLPERPTVSVILPTFGRYKYLAEVLDDLRAQTIAPSQILIADGNPPGERGPAPYAAYADLPLEVMWHEETGICSGRNACLQRATGDYIWFVDDDSRFDARNLEYHLRALVAYGADVSVGPAYMKWRPELAPEQRETTCTFMDCGTTLCTRAILSRVGGFDMQFNQYLAGEDNDLGIRFIRTGGLMVNNPFARRFHYLAPVGGSRSKGSVHVFRRWSLRPRPVQSVYYLARRYFERSTAWDAMVHGSFKSGWRGKPGMPASTRGKLQTVAEELLAAPLTAYRFYRSVQLGREMLREGPRVPALPYDGPVRASDRARSSPVA